MGNVLLQTGNGPLWVMKVCQLVEEFLTNFEKCFLSVGKYHTVSLKTGVKAGLNWSTFLSEHPDHVSTSSVDLLLSS